MRGVRWLGPSARVVSFSSEKTQHGYRNTLLITDVRSRASLPFREVGPEAAPMLGIRASPSGRYLLILLRGAPSEIWAVRGFVLPLFAPVPSSRMEACEYGIAIVMQRSLCGDSYGDGARHWCPGRHCCHGPASGGPLTLFVKSMKSQVLSTKGPVVVQLQ